MQVTCKNLSSTRDSIKEKLSNAYQESTQRGKWARGWIQIARGPQGRENWPFQKPVLFLTYEEHSSEVSVQDI